MKYLTIFLLMSASINLGYCQSDQLRIDDLGDLTRGGQNQMFGKSLPPPSVQGSTYYSDDWYLGSIVFNTGRVYQDFYIRYDIVSGIIETKKDGKVVSFNAEDIQEFTWYNDYAKSKSRFINCKQFDISGTALVGFLEVKYEDEISLLAYPVIKFKKPNYVEGLDVGNRDYRIRKEEEIYLAIDNELIELKKNKNKNLKVLENEFPELRDYVKSNDLSFKTTTDLLNIIKFLNDTTKI